ncbi:hypothetical protein D3C71_1820750 [compost metagenome]
MPAPCQMPARPIAHTVGNTIIEKKPPADATAVGPVARPWRVRQRVTAIATG